MKQIVLGAVFPGGPGVTSWQHPKAGSVIGFESIAYAAQRAEAARIDFLFMPEGLRLIETDGVLDEDKLTGRPDSLTVFAALTAITQDIGLVATLNSTFNEPHDLARQLATLDHLSLGRIGWNVVTSPDAFTGANFRRGGFLPYERRYSRASEFLEVSERLWHSWRADAVLADVQAGHFITEGGISPVDYQGTEIRFSGTLEVPRGPAGRPFIIQSGESEEGRDFAARWADAIFTHHIPHEQAARNFYRDVQQRLARSGRHPGELSVVARLIPVVGNSPGDAEEKAKHLIGEHLRDEVILREFSGIWGRDLSGHDPAGPLPQVDPAPRSAAPYYSGVRTSLETVHQWRALAEQRRFSLRDLAIHLHTEQVLHGTAEQLARYMVEQVENEAVDGYMLIPPFISAGLDELLDTVIPLLQERGAFKAEYGQGTLRQRLASVSDARKIA